MTYAQDLKTRICAEAASPSPVRAVIYARVSTDNESQKDSCSNQIYIAKKYLEKHPNIKLLHIFTDDGISGKNDYNRPAYSKMLDHISQGKVDLIITKALSRLNRDQYNALSLTNLLISRCATVYTLEDGQLHDFEDLNSNLLHGLNYAIDAQYVLRQSISGRRVQELRCQRKELTAKDISFGYKWDKNNKNIYIDKDEAETVVFIFEEYVLRSATPASIYRQLKGRGIHMSERSITNILQDERYIGHFFINKKTSRLGTGNNKTQYIKLPKDRWVLVDRPDLRIIDDELFDIAQRTRETRKSIYMRNGKIDVQARFQGKHLFAAKLYCGCCGKPYIFKRDSSTNTPKYRVLNHSECANPVNSILEKDLENITKIAIKDTLDSQEDICSGLERLLTQCVEELQGQTKATDKLVVQREKKEQQIDTLINELAEGGLSEAARNRIKAKLNDIENDVDELSRTISAAEATKYDSSYVTKQIQTIREAFKDLHGFTEIDRDRVSNYIDRIIVHENSDLDVILRSGRTVYANIGQFHFLRENREDNDDCTDGDPDEDPHHNKVKMRNKDVPYSSPGSYRSPPDP